MSDEGSIDSVSIRLMVVTDPTPACGRSLVEVVEECLEAGAPAIQLRDKAASDAKLYDLALQLGEHTRRHGALLIVNDRFDVALAAGADGVHLGPDDIPVETVRMHADESFLIGYSTDNPVAGMLAASAGADYLGVGAVFGTSSKPGLIDQAIGIDRVSQVLHRAGLPGVGIGGISPDNASELFATGAGVAVLSSVIHAQHPGDVVRRFLQIATQSMP
ncbi:MAG: thiamine phosphate synthase [Gemmatimonadales bacterium]|nr:MAG: thiamine phosphate synthase [Gemmatimonadales bacterium]